MTEHERGAYGLTEFARITGLSATAVQQGMDSGRIPELDRIGRRRFIPATWVHQWLTKVVNTPTAT